MTRIHVSGLHCPTCGASEMHPDNEHLLIRGYKVYNNNHWWSQCLVCAGYYNPDLTPKQPAPGQLDPKDYNREAGWF